MLDILLQYDPWKKSQKKLAESALPYLGEEAVICTQPSASLACVKTLLGTGANINAMTDREPFNIITTAIRESAPIEFISDLLDLGANASVKMSMPWTAVPLHCCSISDRADVMTLLLKKGANLNIQDQDGDTAIVDALAFGALKCIKLCLQSGIDCTIKNHVGQTILHKVAKYGTIEIMELFIEAQIRGVDVNAVGPQGTARDILKARQDFSLALHEAFESLIFSIRPVRDKEETATSIKQESKSYTPFDIRHGEEISKGEDVSEVEEFWDASETW